MMSYLKFNKEELVNLEYSLKREVLSTNRAGGYSSTTVVCCNTRKYHGLLVLPISEFGGENHVLLSSLDETIVQHGQSFNLGIHKYPGVYEPRGHKYIVDLAYDPLFSLTYRAVSYTHLDVYKRQRYDFWYSGFKCYPHATGKIGTERNGFSVVVRGGVRGAGRGG